MVLVMTASRALCLLCLAVGVATAQGPMRGGGSRVPPFEAPTRAKNDAERRVLAVLTEARQQGRIHLEVPETDGRMLRLLAEAIDAKRIVEIGTSTGYSGMWFGLALIKTGGTMTTFELDPGRAAQARKHFEQAGISKQITVVEGDAHKNVAQVKGPVDLVFIDAEKDGYVDYLQRVLPHVRPGGIILAHNVEMVKPYVDAVNGNPDLETLYYMHGNGLAITLKKR